MARGPEEAGEWKRGKRKVGKRTGTGQGDGIFIFIIISFKMGGVERTPGNRILISKYSLSFCRKRCFLSSQFSQCFYVLTLIQTKHWQNLKG